MAPGIELGGESVAKFVVDKIKRDGILNTIILSIWYGSSNLDY